MRCLVDDIEKATAIKKYLKTKTKEKILGNMLTQNFFDIPIKEEIELFELYKEKTNDTLMINHIKRLIDLVTKTLDIYPLNKSKLVGFSNKEEVIINGFIANNEKIPRGSISIEIENLIIGEKQMYKTEINKDGSFTINIPLSYSQDMKIKYNKQQRLYASPGDHIFILFDKNQQNALFFGDNGETNNLINNYFRIYDTNFNEFFNEKYSKEVKPVTYYNYRKTRYNKEKELLEVFIKKYSTDSVASNWLRYHNKYVYASDLLIASKIQKTYKKR